MDKKLLICILSSIKNKKRINVLNETFLKHLNNDEYIIYTDFLDNKIKNIIKITDLVDYNDAEIKNLKMIEFIILNQSFYEKYDWFLFCDDDVFINIENLKKYINDYNIDKNIVYGWEISKRTEFLNPIWKKMNVETFNEYPCGGPGYLISFENIEKIVKSEKFKEYKEKEFQISGFSDVTIGLLMHYNNIKFQNNFAFCKYSPKQLGISKKDFNKFISFHYVNEFEIIELYKEIYKE